MQTSGTDKERGVMEQVIPQSKVGNKSAAYRRMGWFMAVILVLVLCAAEGKSSLMGGLTLHSGAF